MDRRGGTSGKKRTYNTGTFRATSLMSSFRPPGAPETGRCFSIVGNAPGIMRKPARVIHMNPCARWQESAMRGSLSSSSRYRTKKFLGGSGGELPLPFSAVEVRGVVKQGIEGWTWDNCKPLESLWYIRGVFRGSLEAWRDDDGLLLYKLCIRSAA